MKFLPGMKKMTAVRVLAILAVMLIELSCGDTYRPIVLPINPNPPDPESLHFALVVTDNGADNPGISSRIDVSGDSNMGNATVGIGPVHAALIPSMTVAYVANQLQDVVSAYPAGNISPVATISLPPGSAPAFVHTTQNDTVYVANSGNATVSAISTSSNVINTTIPVGSNPIAMAETPDTKKLYVVNQGGNSVTAVNVVDKSVNATIPVGAGPTWAAARSDSARIFVLNQGSGTISVIETVTDTVLNTIPVPGANFMFYDRKRNRLYVTLASSKQLAVIDVSVDPPSAFPAVDLSAVCGAGCALDGVTALLDGTRVYVSSHSAWATCSHLDGVPDDTPPCLTTQVTVIKAQLNTVEKTITTQRKIIVDGVVKGSKSDAGALTACDSARFRRYIASSGDSSRVYVANCDAGGTDIIRTSDDTFVLNLTAPLHSAGEGPNHDVFLPQNPVFVVPGR